MRPKNWKNPYDVSKARSRINGILITPYTEKDLEIAREQAFEAGADAYEEALKKEGIFTYGHHTPDISLDDAPSESGYWVFIPVEGK